MGYLAINSIVLAIHEMYIIKEKTCNIRFIYSLLVGWWCKWAQYPLFLSSQVNQHKYGRHPVSLQSKQSTNCCSWWHWNSLFACPPKHGSSGTAFAAVFHSCCAWWCIAFSPVVVDQQSYFQHWIKHHQSNIGAEILHYHRCDYIKSKYYPRNECYFSSWNINLSVFQYQSWIWSTFLFFSFFYTDNYISGMVQIVMP